MSETRSKPWYKEPWPWFLISVPAIGMIGCMITIYFALTSNPDKDIKIAHHKRGLVITAADDTTTIKPVIHK